MKALPRWVSAAEVGSFYALVHFIMWAGGRFRPTMLVLALLMVALCVGSNILHGDSAERVGFDPKHFWPAFRLAGFVITPVVIPLLVMGFMKREVWPLTFLWSLASYPTWSFAQEYALLGFVNNRLEDALPGHEKLLPWINGFLFAMAHLPNPILMTATFAAGTVFTWIFRRHRHLIPLAVAHAAVGIAIGLAFADLYGVMSVGPGYGRRMGALPLVN